MVIGLLVAGLFSVAEPASMRRQDRQPTSEQENETDELLSRLRQALTPQEWKSVEHEDDTVKRVRKLLDFSSSRLSDARDKLKQVAFSEAAQALVQYEAIITGAFYSIDPLTAKNDRKRRSSYKEFDVRTRPQLHTLELLARDFAGQNSPAAENALTNTRRLRAMALNRFSGSKIIKVPASF